MGFRKLLEMTDEYLRAELDDYYIINKSKMDNYIKVMEDQAKIIRQLKLDNERLTERDGNATIILCYSTRNNPFCRESLTVVDFGVADNVYTVQRRSNNGSDK